MKLNATHLEIAVARYFDYRQNLIVPNVSWGFGISYEADMFLVRPSNFIEEIEIKVSMADLKKDKLKDKWGKQFVKTLKKFWYCIPEDLEKHKDKIYQEIPDFAGVLVAEYDNDRKRYYISVLRQAKLNKNAVRITDKQRYNLARLGCMRVWSLKESRNEN